MEERKKIFFAVKQVEEWKRKSYIPLFFEKR